MEHVRWTARPKLNQPTLIAAFAGWNDAGDASTSAVRYLSEQWDATPFAEIDCEEFFDFTETRPTVELADGMSRKICWPSTSLAAATVPGTDSDVVLLLGTEPQLRWRTFARQVTDVAAELGARLVVILGALLAEVPHTRPVPITGSAADSQMVMRLGLRRSHYEGPTGIVGVVHDACTQAGLDTASLWATVPTYVPAATSPKAALALVRRIGTLLDVPVETSLLEVAAHHYEEELDRLVDADDDTAAYVHRLEADSDEAELESGDPLGSIVDSSIADEVERFLRERHRHRPDER